MDARHPSLHAGRAAAHQSDVNHADDLHRDEDRAVGLNHHQDEGFADGLKSCPVAGHGVDQLRAATSDRRPARNVKGGPHIGSLGDAARRHVPTPLALLIDATCPSGCTPHHRRHCHGLRRVEHHASRIGWRCHRPLVRDLRHPHRMDDWDGHRRSSCALCSHRCRHERCDPRERNWGDGRSA